MIILDFIGLLLQKKKRLISVYAKVSHSHLSAGILKNKSVFSPVVVERLIPMNSAICLLVYHEITQISERSL